MYSQYIYTHIHVHVYIYIHIRIHMCIYTYVCVCIICVYTLHSNHDAHIHAGCSRDNCASTISALSTKPKCQALNPKP